MRLVHGDTTVLAVQGRDSDAPTMPRPTRPDTGARRRPAPAGEVVPAPPERPSAGVPGTVVDALDLLAATSWGDERPTAAPCPHTARVRGVRPLDRLADAVGDRARAASALSDGATRATTTMYGVPAGGREDRPPRGLVRRCGTGRRVQDTEVLVACRETFEQAGLLAHSDPARRGHAVAA